MPLVCGLACIVAACLWSIEAFTHYPRDHKRFLSNCQWLHILHNHLSSSICTLFSTARHRGRVYQKFFISTPESGLSLYQCCSVPAPAHSFPSMVLHFLGIAQKGELGACVLPDDAGLQSSSSLTTGSGGSHSPTTCGVALSCHIASCCWCGCFHWDRILGKQSYLLLLFLPSQPKSLSWSPTSWFSSAMLNEGLLSLLECQFHLT